MGVFSPDISPYFGTFLLSACEEGVISNEQSLNELVEVERRSSGEAINVVESDAIMPEVNSVEMDLLNEGRNGKSDTNQFAHGLIAEEGLYTFPEEIIVTEGQYKKGQWIEVVVFAETDLDMPRGANGSWKGLRKFLKLADKEKVALYKLCYQEDKSGAGTRLVWQKTHNLQNGGAGKNCKKSGNSVNSRSLHLEQGDQVLGFFNSGKAKKDQAAVRAQFTISN